ncbi:MULTISPECIES: hypothetical protein [Citrobacter]|uniref:hypothetical protein n=1 Tax=Citrobacter sp. C13 TaxID=2769347 RepID=UPI0011EF1A27|nr:hypothetical protein F0328_13220 [Citrobacter portucalensis]MBD0805872.1 hypothetical protein [Citrobacter sp. C13]
MPHQTTIPMFLSIHSLMPLYPLIGVDLAEMPVLLRQFANEVLSTQALIPFRVCCMAAIKADLTSAMRGMICTLLMLFLYKVILM